MEEGRRGFSADQAAADEWLAEHADAFADMPAELPVEEAVASGDSIDLDPDASADRREYVERTDASDTLLG